VVSWQAPSMFPACLQPVAVCMLCSKGLSTSNPRPPVRWIRNPGIPHLPPPPFVQGGLGCTPQSQLFFRRSCDGGYPTSYPSSKLLDSNCSRGDLRWPEIRDEAVRARHRRQIGEGEPLTREVVLIICCRDPTSHHRSRDDVEALSTMLTLALSFLSTRGQHVPVTGLISHPD